MASIRAKLTTAYAGALVVTVVAFSAAMYWARRTTAVTNLEPQVELYRDLAVQVVRSVAKSGQPVTQETDTLVGRVFTEQVKSLLEVVPNYLLILADKADRKEDRVLFLSEAVRDLDYDDLTALTEKAINSRSGSWGVLTLPSSGEQLLIAVRDGAAPRTGVGRIVAGVPLSAATVGPGEFLGTLVVIAPLILGVSLLGAYFIAGRAFRQVDRMINEVEAISDGRSLHRRLAVESTGDELGRLGATLNEMIGRLETSFAALRRFTGDASHELKTPLAVLRADVERAMHAPAGSHEQLAALEEALQETTRMGDLVESLLTLARADEGRFDLHRQRVDLEPLAHDVCETAVILGEDAGLTVAMSAVEPACVMGDPTRLRQLFLNLVTNAIKYTPRGGRVELSLTVRDGMAHFSVRDTGIGIAAADLPFVFERFWRADRVRSRATGRGGAGLGLAISQWIAQAHGGTLTVQSRLGRGSIFTVTIPTAAQGAAELAVPGPESGAVISESAPVA